MNFKNQLKDFSGGISLRKVENDLELLPSYPGVYLILTEDLIYVGKTKRTLRKRIKELIRYGKGLSSNHRGGRLIWRLPNVWNARIFYKRSNFPRELEKSLLKEFKQTHGKYPYGNKIG